MRKRVQICRACNLNWPGHKTCPECGAEIVEVEVQNAEYRIERLPQFEDLARQYRLGEEERWEGRVPKEDSE